MIAETIKNIEDQLRAAESLSQERRSELLRLVERLRSEISDLSATHDEEAQSIARFAELTAHEATRGKRNPELLDISLRGLSSSVSGFEQSHPNLVQVVNAISHTLSSLGI
jgi:hypothetical protein